MIPAFMPYRSQSAGNTRTAKPCSSASSPAMVSAPRAPPWRILMSMPPGRPPSSLSIASRSVQSRDPQTKTFIGTSSGTGWVHAVPGLPQTDRNRPGSRSREMQGIWLYRPSRGPANAGGLPNEWRVPVVWLGGLCCGSSGQALGREHDGMKVRGGHFGIPGDWRVRVHVRPVVRHGHAPP